MGESGQIQLVRSRLSILGQPPRVTGTSSDFSQGFYRGTAMLALTALRSVWVFNVLQVRFRTQTFVRLVTTDPWFLATKVV